ncbi:MAG TPA: transcriptional regulator CynR [Nitrospiraceae bacterium]|nr:transcriptional regulator CynR [Nitrospiraceae bacterium]
MELRHIRYFLAVAETLHFRRGAERASVSQPALSQQIKQLEEEVGAPLFERLGKSVRLTRAGAVLLEHARRALRELESARATIAAEEGLRCGTLPVGVLQTVNAYLIPEIVSRFAQAYPDVSLTVEELSGLQIEEGIASGHLDAGIGFIPPSLEKLESDTLFEEDLVLITPQRHRLAKRSRIAIADLADEPLVLLPQTFCARRLIDETFQAATVRPTVAIEMNSIEGILATIRAGARATILPRLSLGIKPTGRLRAIDLINPTPRRRVGLLWRRGGYRSPAAQAFAEQARAVVSEYFH